MTDIKLNAVLYCRVCYNNEEALNKQEEALRAYCKEKNVNVIESVHEVGPAKISNSPYFRSLAKQLASNEVSKPVDIILATEPSRFARNQMDWLLLGEFCRKNKVTVETIMDNITDYEESYIILSCQF